MLRLILISICLAVIATSSATAAETSRATFTPATGTWRFDYRSTVTQQMVSETFVLHSLTAPLVTSTVDGTTGTTRYRYSATNGASGRQPIASLWVRASPIRIDSPVPPVPPYPADSNATAVRAWQDAVDKEYETMQAAQAAIINSPTGWDGSIGLNTQPTAFG